MGTWLIFQGLLEVTNAVYREGLMDSLMESVAGKSPAKDRTLNRPQLRLVEHTKALERMVLKELGKLPS